jgi:hypothetical protein
MFFYDIDTSAQLFPDLGVPDRKRSLSRMKTCPLHLERAENASNLQPLVAEGTRLAN